MTDTRPVTSKARGVCRYYNTSTGCRAGNSCKFLHGEEKLTPFDKSKICKFYAAGFCKRGATCWFVHAQPDAAPTQDPDTGVASEDDVCCICIEKPTTYGLMGGCSHIFCIGCIMEWRNPRGKSDDVVASGVTKKCPLCRASSQFVTPSSHFYPEGHPHKAIAIEKYRQSTSRVPCKYFQRSPPNKRYCPFGKDCFYQHLNDDGTPYVFNEGVDSLIRRRQYRELRAQLQADTSPLDLHPLQSVLARLQLLTATVSEAVSYDESVDDYLYAGDDEDDWMGYLLDDSSDLMISELAENIMSTMFALGPGHSPSTPPEVASSHDSSHGAESSTTSTPVIEVQELPSPNEQSIEPSGSVISGATLLDQPGSRSSQSTPLGCIYETDLQPIPRPSSAPGLMPSRFSTSIPGRALSSRVDSIEGTDNLLAVPWTGQIPPFEPTRADDSRTLPTDNGPSSVESVESSPGGEQAFVTPLPAATPVSISASMAETASNNAAICDGCAAAAVQDSDPPFMTDGRGRVVWSSSTAGARSRRGRTTAPLSAVMTSRDKPRGDAQTRDHSQTNSPVVRPASLARGGSGRHDRQSVPDRGE